MATRIGSPSLTLRDLSRLEVLDVLRSKPTLSRSELAGRVHVSRATVSGIVSELIQAGLLEEIGEGNSTGGRPPIQLRYRPDSRLAVGVVLINHDIQAALTDMEGNSLRRLDRPLSGFTPHAMLQDMSDVVEELLAGVPRRQVLGIGVGTPGIVDLESGTIAISVSQGWLDGPIPARDYLQERWKLPVYVANRSRVAALGELKVGVGRGFSDLIYLFLGRGIVAGIVIGGRLYFGPASSAGEIGHVSVAPNGPLCKCGNRGCLEVYAGEEAILARARALAREGQSSLRQVVGQDLERLTLEPVVQAARQGDATALTVFRETGTRVGTAVATLINLFNPEMVVIGGPIGCSAGSILLQPICEQTQRSALPRILMNTRIVSASLGMQAAAIGASVLAISQTPVEAFFRV